MRKILTIDQLHNYASILPNVSDEEKIDNIISAIIQQYDVINYELSYSQELFRARKCTKDGFLKTTDLDHPPPESTKPGRLNEPNEPILYTSISAASTLEEIKAEKDDYIHVVAYELIDNLRCAIVGEISHFSRWGAMLCPNAEVENGFRMFMQNQPDNVKKSIIYTDSFLSSMLKDPNASKNNYLISRKIAKNLLKKHQYIDAIIYQGVALDSSFNIAIRPDLLNKKLIQTTNFVLHVNNKYNYGLYDLSVIKESNGSTQNKYIKWLQS